MLCSGNILIGIKMNLFVKIVSFLVIFFCASLEMPVKGMLLDPFNRRVQVRALVDGNNNPVRVTAQEEGFVGLGRAGGNIGYERVLPRVSMGDLLEGDQREAFEQRDTLKKQWENFYITNTFIVALAIALRKDISAGFTSVSVQSFLENNTWAKRCVNFIKGCREKYPRAAKALPSLICGSALIGISIAPFLYFNRFFKLAHVPKEFQVTPMADGHVNILQRVTGENSHYGYEMGRQVLHIQRHLSGPLGYGQGDIDTQFQDFRSVNLLRFLSFMSSAGFFAAGSCMVLGALGIDINILDPQWHEVTVTT